MFWLQMQQELKKPDPEFSEWEFVRVLSNPKYKASDFNKLMDEYEKKAIHLSYAYFDAYCHYLVMEIVKEMKRKRRNPSPF